jgi:hypothetical protein
VSAHTPGPWHAMDPKGALNFNFVIVSEHREDAVVACTGGDMPEEEANARLIAAAPELLEAARLSLAWLTAAGYQDVLPTGALEAAIAKAEGR